MKQRFRALRSRIEPFLRAFLDAPDSLSLRIDFYLVGQETAIEQGRPLLAWLNHQLLHWYERQIPRDAPVPPDECAP
jgi:hypothetical protein